MKNTSDYIWEIKNKKPAKSTKEIIDSLLKTRGLATPKSKKEFFSPTDPGKIKLKSIKISESQITKAIKRLVKAKKNNDKIIVFGDYDADGVCSTAILWETLHELGFNTMPFIPDRFKDGYGLSPDTIKKVIKEFPDTKIIITVDNGIVAKKAAKEAKKLKIELIITDHHEKDKTPPKAISIIHTTALSGSGVSWMFAREVAKHFKKAKLVEDKIELVAIGTIADQMPLLNENRSFVFHGLKKLETSKRKGLAELFKDAAVEPKNINTYHVNFYIAPRLNAPGRLTHAIESLRLLCTQSPNRALELAKNVGKLNYERKQIVDEVITHAGVASKKISEDSAIILHDDIYHEGVIGLAASKLVDQYYKPSIVISTKGDIAKASGRSIKGFHLTKAIRKLSHLTIEGGGHEMAAGFSISKKNIKKFITEFNKIAKKQLTPDLLTKKLKIDSILSFQNINKALLVELKQFEPFGNGNYAPLFATEDVHIDSIRTVGKDSSHLKMKVSKDQSSFDTIGFGLGEFASQVKKGQEIDIAYKPEENEWNGQKTIQLQIKDLKKTDPTIIVL